MKITLELLEKFSACSEGIEFVTEKNLIGLEAPEFLKKLIKLKKLDWANWLTARVLTDIDKARYAVFAAEQVIEFFEEKYPNDPRPRKAIEAARAYIANPCKETDAAYAAAAASAADAASYDAAYAAYDAATLTKIVSYGIELIKKQ